MLRVELQNDFARIDEMGDLDPDNFSELDTPKNLTKAKKKSRALSTVDKVQLPRLDTGRSVGRAVTSDRARRSNQWGDRVGGLAQRGIHRQGYPRGHRPRPDHLAR